MGLTAAQRQRASNNWTYPTYTQECMTRSFHAAGRGVTLTDYASKVCFGLGFAGTALEITHPSALYFMTAAIGFAAGFGLRKLSKMTDRQAGNLYTPTAPHSYGDEASVTGRLTELLNSCSPAP